ncbi:class I SAM-dependent methyltransferase [Acidiphilium sp.]|uniref:class I SAM-dependent methyltransferase n=1 Tax=Acidiphilium sp. TaxID=527 RepID=UPI003CFC7CC5
MTRESPWLLTPRPGETTADFQDRRGRAFFDGQRTDSAEFWRRLGRDDIDLAGRRVLELGCGHGALSVEAAAKGATSVLGVDIDADPIAFAQRHVPQAYPDLAPALAFRCEDIAEIPDSEPFDIVLCKDTAEHILDLAGVFAQVHRLLKPGGRFVIGTSPLYYSPFGDHGRYLGPGLPWLAALLPEPLLFALASRRNGGTIRSAADVGLNKMTPARFRSLFDGSNWQVESIRYNAGDKRFMAAMRLLRRFRPIEKYFTVSIYAVIRRR